MTSVIPLLTSTLHEHAWDLLPIEHVILCMERIIQTFGEDEVLCCFLPCTEDGVEILLECRGNFFDVACVLVRGLYHGSIGLVAMDSLDLFEAPNTYPEEQSRSDPVGQNLLTLLHYIMNLIVHAALMPSFEFEEYLEQSSDTEGEESNLGKLAKISREVWHSFLHSSSHILSRKTLSVVYGGRARRQLSTVVSVMFALRLLTEFKVQKQRAGLAEGMHVLAADIPQYIILRHSASHVAYFKNLQCMHRNIMQTIADFYRQKQRLPPQPDASWPIGRICQFSAHLRQRSLPTTTQVSPLRPSRSSQSTWSSTWSSALSSTATATLGLSPPHAMALSLPLPVMHSMSLTEALCATWHLTPLPLVQAHLSVPSFCLAAGASFIHPVSRPFLTDAQQRLAIVVSLWEEWNVSSTEHDWLQGFLTDSPVGAHATSHANATQKQPIKIPPPLLYDSPPHLLSSPPSISTECSHIHIRKRFRPSTEHLESRDWRRFLSQGV